MLNKSVIVESGTAARTMAAYIDLNPVRAWFCDQGAGFEAEKWREVSRLYRRMMGLALGRKPGRTEVSQAAKGLGQTTMNTAEMLEGGDNETVLKDLRLAKMLRCRVRYFTDGAVIGTRSL